MKSAIKSKFIYRGGNVPSSNTSMNKQTKQNQKQNKSIKLNKNQKQQVRQAIQSGTKSNRGGILAEAGSILGSVVGMPGIGKFLGSSIASVLGRGDYTIAGQGIKSNSLVTGTTPPMFGNERSDRATILSHREYLTDITSGPTLVDGATSFNYRTYNINPGLMTSFPWLARVAQNFEEYEMLGCLFEYKGTSAGALNSTNTALGTVVLSTQYNVLNDPFNSKLTQENYEFAQSLKPAESGLHAVECARNQNVLPRLYIRTGLPPADADMRLYDMGEFQISTVGMQAANVVLGELWVTYHIALYKPRVPQTIDNQILTSRLSAASGTSDKPFGTGVVNSVAGSTLALKYSTDVNGGVISFPADVSSGYFLTVISCSISGAYSGIQISNINNTAVTSQFNQSSTGGTNSCSYAIVQVLGPGAKYRVTGSGTWALTVPVLLTTQWYVGAPTMPDTIYNNSERRLLLAYAKRLARLHKGEIDLNRLFAEDPMLKDPDDSEMIFHDPDEGEDKEVPEKEVLAKRTE